MTLKIEIDYLPVDDASDIISYVTNVVNESVEKNNPLISMTYSYQKTEEKNYQATIEPLAESTPFQRYMTNTVKE